MFEGPAMVVMWLITPALVVIGSFGAGLAFPPSPNFGPQNPRETPQNVRDAPVDTW
jgi:hypothetical protein